MALAEMSERIKPRPETVTNETEAAERSLLAYSRQAWHAVRPGDKWVDGWAFGCICEHAQAVIEGQIKKLGIAVPPRHGKSLAVGVFMPTWAWVRESWKRFIFVSYSAKLATRDSIACRDLILSKWYQDRWGYRFAFKEDMNRQDQFNNNRGGFRISTTPGGTATGEGCDVMVADDITSVEDAFSPAALEHAFRFWTQTMTMRFMDPENVARIISMQRTAKNDLLGRAMAENMGYEVLTLPFEGEPSRVYFLPDPKAAAAQSSEPAPKPKHPIELTRLQIARPELRDAREPGAILWPERFRTPDTIADLKRSVKAGQAGQLQQRPEGEAGAVFKPSKYRKFYPRWTESGLVFILGSGPGAREVPASECLWYQTCDTAMKAEQSNDFTAFCTVAKTRCGALLVWNVFRCRLLIPEQWPAMKHFRDGLPAWDEPSRTFVVPGSARPWPGRLSFQSVESKNSGISLLQLARSEGRPLKELDADTNKVLRSATVAQLYEAGAVYHNAEGTWVEEFEDELSQFPAGAHDDMVDVISYAGILFVHDALLAAYSGPMVWNQRVFDEMEARQKIEDAVRRGDAEGAWVPPSLRATIEAPTQAESLDDILNALRGAPKPKEPVVLDDGTIDPRLIFGDDHD